MSETKGQYSLKRRFTDAGCVNEGGSHAKITATTELRSSSVTFNWRIENFDVICPVDCEEFDRIKSPGFTVGEEIGMKSDWFVSIVGESKSISYYLELKSLDQKESGERARQDNSVTCKFAITFGNEDIEEEFNNSGSQYIEKFTPESDSEAWGCSDSISIAELHENKDKYLHDHYLHICLKMMIFAEPNSVVTALPHPFNRNVSTRILESFCTDFNELLKTGKHADVEIVCGDKTFSAHKNILSARSKVFDTMFDSDMKESSTNQIILSDMDAETVYAILEHIYTGKVVIKESSSYTELIYGAEKYDLPELKQYCFDKMLECVTDDTIGALAVAVDAYNADEETKNSVKKYCQSNISTLLKSPSFKKLLMAHPHAFLQD